MKKILSIFAMLLIVTACFAQKANVSKAYKKSEAMEKPDFDGAIDLIEAALTDETTKNDPYTWWVAAHIYDRIIDFEIQKPILMTGSTDEERKNESAFRAFDYYLKAVELEKIPNAKGKISDKYTKKAKDMLSWYYTQMLLVNYGAAAGQVPDYALAVKAFEKHLAIPDLPFIAGQKDCHKNPDCPKKDSTYHQVAYYDAIYTQLSADNVKNEAKKNELIDKAIEKYERIRKNGYKENDIHIFLYNLYESRQETANMLRILDEGIERFPQEFFYLGTKINFYIDSNRGKEAMEYLDKAIEKDPKNPQYYNVKGNILTIMGNRAEAAKMYNKAVELAPDNAMFWNNRGDLLFQEGTDIETQAATIRDAKTSDALMAAAKAKFKEAQENYEKAVELKDDYLEAMINLRRLYVRFDGENSKKYKEISDKINYLRNR